MKIDSETLAKLKALAMNGDGRKARDIGTVAIAHAVMARAPAYARTAYSEAMRAVDTKRRLRTYSTRG